MQHRIRIDGTEQTCDVTGSGSHFEVVIGSERLTVQVDACGCLGDFRVVVNGEPVSLRLSGADARALLDGREVARDFDGRERMVARAGGDPAAPANAGPARRERPVTGELKAMMPGVVVRVPVAPGQTVTKGQVLVVLEAMKMENELKAPCGGVLAELHVIAGQSVAKGQPLARVQEA